MKITKNPACFSRTILIILVALTVIVFALFWLVGFDMPFFDNPKFNAPLLTDVVIYFVYLMLFLAIAAVVVSMSGWARRMMKSELLTIRLERQRIHAIWQDYLWICVRLRNMDIITQLTRVDIYPGTTLLARFLNKLVMILK